MLHSLTSGPLANKAKSRAPAGDTAHLIEDPAAYLDVYPGPVDWKPAFMDDDADTLMTEAA
ncbi:hypothetical protein [Streptomyces sp. NRRL S-350]|uniref:hypothetical protein n=1 Tax=Streptomyces sp. NRRL S-350 TaxID=1463902 RepID=UPI00131D937C|nr:hypothetical protein [Streptomyces sp. NRRL S-350]